MRNVLAGQYELIRNTRNTLLDFLEGIPAEQLHTAVPGFGHESIMRTHIHVADCYRYWLGEFALRQTDFSFASEEEVTNSTVEQLRERFKRVDEVVQEFLRTFENRWLESVQNHFKWQEEPLVTTPLWLLTHTETHEFHHKGQVVSMARLLGHVPPDTDLVL